MRAKVLVVFPVKRLHGHPVGELLERLAVQRDGDAGVGVEGELHAVQHLGLPLLLRWRIRVIFVPGSGVQAMFMMMTTTKIILTKMQELSFRLVSSSPD